MVCKLKVEKKGNTMPNPKANGAIFQKKGRNSISRNIKCSGKTKIDPSQEVLPIPKKKSKKR